MLTKIYGPSSEGQRRYSPPECRGATKDRIYGNPDPKHINTSFAEHNNLKRSGALAPLHPSNQRVL
jgi:hypothetical protein